MAFQPTWPDKTSNVTCNICEVVNESNWENAKDDLLVCIKSSCKKRYRPICRACMKQSHGKKSKNPIHNLKKDATNFVTLKQWYNITAIKKCESDHAAITLVKSSAKSVVIRPLGVVGAYCFADKALLQLVRKLPEKITKDSLKQYSQALIKGISKSEVTGKALIKNMAKSQALVSGVMFALEVGWNLVQYAYDDSINYNELMRRNKKAGVAHCSAAVGSIIGGCIGAFFGPWGAFAGAAIGGGISDFTARKIFDSQSPNARQKQVEIALIRFDYGKVKLNDVLKDKKNFNLQQLQDRYHLKAPFNHPDGILKGKGSTDEELKAKWEEFYACYNVLLVLCKERDAKNGKKGN
eukprot:513220_1